MEKRVLDQTIRDYFGIGFPELREKYRFLKKRKPICLPFDDDEFRYGYHRYEERPINAKPNRFLEKSTDGTTRNGRVV